MRTGTYYKNGVPICIRDDKTCQSGADRKTEMGVFHKFMFLGSDTQHHFMARTIHSN